MRSAFAFSIALFVFQAAPACAAKRAQPDVSPADIEAWGQIAKVANEVCTPIETSGYSAGAAASASAEGTIPKLVAKLLKVSIKATVKEGGQVWAGPLQKD